MKPSDTFFDDGQARRRRLARPISTLLRGLAVAALLPFEWLERLRSGGAVRRRPARSRALSGLGWLCGLEILCVICV